MSIFRSTFESHVKKQLLARQKAMINRTSHNLSYLNSRNAWVRMTSSVNVNGSADLAKAYVLHGGTLNPDGSFKEGIGKSFRNAYSNEGNRLGIRPMPGITSVDIKSKSAYGSLREAIVNFNCWDISQLEDLELLYMRPGYTLLLEWGWAPYITSDGTYNPTFTNFYDILNKPPTSRTQLFADLFQKSKDYEGNYDAMFGYVKNYEWSARMDGGYDCKTTVITTGEIIESLKINYIKPTPITIEDKNSLLYYQFSETSTASSGWLTAYSENALAGMWAEAYYKLNPQTPFAFDSLFTSENTYGCTNFYISSNVDQDKSLSRQNNNVQRYITLDLVFKLLNKYIIATGRTGGVEEALVALSSLDFYNNDIKISAHPLQVSVDPGVCLIKSPKWYEEGGEISQTIEQAANNEDVKAALLSYNLLKSYANDYDSNSGEDEVLKQVLFSLQTRIKTTEQYLALTKLITDKPLKLGGTSYNDLSSFLNAMSDETEGNAYKDADDLRKAWSSIKVNVDFTGEITGEGYDKINPGNYNRIQELYKERTEIALAYAVPGGAAAYRFTTGKDLIIADNENAARLEQFGLDTGLFNSVYTRFKYNALFEFIGVSNITITTQEKVELSQAASLATIASGAEQALANFQLLKDLPRDYFVSTDLSDNDASELAYLKGIYVNLDYLYLKAISTEQQSADDKGKEEINLYNYVKSMMSDIQTSLGNVQDFEVHVDPVNNNIARVIDVKYCEYPGAIYENLYELPVHQLGSTVRSYSLQSQIFPNQSSLVAIGSQAQSKGALGIQTNTLIDFNKSLTDRILTEKGDGTFDVLIAKLKEAGQASIDINNGLSKIILLFSTAQKIEDQSLPSYDTEISSAKTGLRDTIAQMQSVSNSPSRNIIPTKFSCEIDGIGGMVIGNMFRLPNHVMPRGYRGVGVGSKLANAVTGISHTIKDGDWVTKIDSLNIVLDSNPSPAAKAGSKVTDWGSILGGTVGTIIN